MKTMLLILLLAITTIASQEQETTESTESNITKEIPEFVIDSANYGMISSKDAFFTLGSRSFGTMATVFSFATKEDAQKYIEEFGGCILDYDTYVKMDEEDEKKYIKEHAIAPIVKDINTTKLTDANSTNAVDINNTNIKDTDAINLKPEPKTIKKVTPKKKYDEGNLRNFL